MTIPEAIEAMKRNVGSPNEAGAMLVLADVWEEAEDNVQCDCHPPYTYRCQKCHGTGYVSNGNSARAEALRLLGECGKVGKDGVGYYSEDGDEASEGLVSDDWYMASCERRRPQDFARIVPERLTLMDAYAAADPDTRERWARETRALVPFVTCPTCNGHGTNGTPAGEMGCVRCSTGPHERGTGRTPATQEATR